MTHKVSAARFWLHTFLTIAFVFSYVPFDFAQEKSQPPNQGQAQTQTDGQTAAPKAQEEEKPAAEAPAEVKAPAQEPAEASATATTTPEAKATTEASPETQTAVVDNLAASQNVTLDFKEADIRNVLKIISFKSGVNIVATPEVVGNVTIRLVDVPWETALDAILKTYGFGYEKRGNIITVAPMEKLAALKKQEVEFSQVQPTVTEVFNLRYIDAQDAKKALDQQLSPRGKITVLETTGQAGWEFGSQELSKRKRASEGRISRSKTFIISDIPPVLEKIAQILKEIDVQPQQILIQARLVEVNHDKTKDIGVTWGTGEGGPTSLTTHRDVVTTYVTTADPSGSGLTQKEFKEIITLPTIPLASNVKKVFGAQSMPAIDVGEFLFQKLTGTEFEMVLKAIESKDYANTLSAPHIMTLNNQEASILIGTKYPLIKATVAQDTGQITGQSLDRYQDIGIQLNVVPQTSGDNKINLIVHPAVSTFSQTVDAVSATGVTMAKYPIIIVREAETQILLEDGETVVIGGLMQDTKTDARTGIPFLKDLPYIGQFFRRDQVTTTKTDLLIFLTARLVRQDEFSAEKISKAEKSVGIEKSVQKESATESEEKKKQ